MAADGTAPAGVGEHELPGQVRSVLRGHEGAVLTVRFNHDGNYCLSGGKDRSVRLWNPHKGLLIKTYSGHGHAVRDVASSSDNSRIASCGGDKQPFLWDVGTGRIIRKFRGHDSEINAIRFNLEDTVLVTGGYDRSLRVWDCRSQSPAPIQGMDPFTDSVNSVAVTRSEIVAGSVDGSVRTFDIRKGRLLSDHLGHPVTCVTLSNDGNCILASCLDGALRLIDRGTGELLNEYRGHVNTSYKVDSCMTSDDAYILSGSEDGSIVCWDLVEASTVATLSAHTATVCSLSYHPKDCCLLSSSVDGTIRVWTS